MSRLCISGPVTGCDNRNLDAFQSAQRMLVDAGHMAVIPHQIVPPSKTRATAMLLCLHDLTAYSASYGFLAPYYDGVALLEGWEQSEGARLEKAVAETCGIPCKTVGEWLEEAR